MQQYLQMADLLERAYDNDPAVIPEIVDSIVEPVSRPTYQPTSEYGIYLLTLRAEAELRMRGMQGYEINPRHAESLWPYVIQRLNEARRAVRPTVVPTESHPPTGPSSSG